ncbi:MAG: ATP-binding protein [candidate division Zixibacteria bacterium]|nr:ATP-binding protein [candidate division Zixibacteria bacterium]
MSHKRNKFESEIHLGFLVIILALVFISFMSNLIIYRSRDARRESLISNMQSASVAIGRVLPKVAKPHLSAQHKTEFLRTYGLNDIHIFNTQSEDKSLGSPRNWLESKSRQLPPEISDLAGELLKSGSSILKQGSDDDYFFICPIVGNRHNLLILSTKDSELAYLDDSQRTVVTIGVIVIAVLVVFYLLLSRVIFAPFRRLKQEARQAGRSIDNSNDDVYAVVEEYRKVIGELKEKERQLLRFNEGIRQKADSLEQFNKYLLQSIRSGIITVDLDGNVVTVNGAASDILGVGIEECLGKSYRTLLPEDSILTNTLNQSLDNIHGSEYKETNVTTCDGRYLTLGMSTSIISGGNSQPLGVSMLLNDLSEITQLRSELEAKERMAVLGEMTGGLAHQLRNSIGAISGYLTLLKRRLGKKGIDEDSVSALIAEVTEAQNLVERFLQFSRPLQAYSTPESVVGLIDEIVKSFKARDDFDNIQFRVVVQDNQLTANLDALLFKQAITNLIENAVLAYDSTDGEVLIEIESSDMEMTICISDKGCGISAEDIDKIFTPFFSSRAAGTGLGLPLTRKIIDLHNGHLSVSSKQGEGTVFTVSLPLAQSVKDHSQQSIEQTHAIT